jgi:hypothetical protein
MQLKTVEETNIIGGKAFPLTTYAIVDKLPICIECKKLLNENDICFFCLLCNKFFCYECNEQDSFVCHKFIGQFKTHSDAMVKIKLGD